MGRGGWGGEVAVGDDVERSPRPRRRAAELVEADNTRAAGGAVLAPRKVGIADVNRAAKELNASHTLQVRGLVVRGSGAGRSLNPTPSFCFPALTPHNELPPCPATCQAIACAPTLERVWLVATVAQFQATGLDLAAFEDVVPRFSTLCTTVCGVAAPTVDEVRGG